MVSFGFLPKIQLAAAMMGRLSLPAPATRITLAGMVHPRHLPAFFLANSLKSVQKTVLLFLRWTAGTGCDILSLEGDISSLRHKRRKPWMTKYLHRRA